MSVIPATAGIHPVLLRHTGESQYPVFQDREEDWTPAFAGVTDVDVTLASVGVHLLESLQGLLELSS